MNNKTQLLIGIGAAYAAKCQQCLKSLLTLAQKSGIEEAEIKEVLKIARQVGLSSLKSMNKFASSLLDNPTENQKTDSEESCGCM